MDSSDFEYFKGIINEIKKYEIEWSETDIVLDNYYSKIREINNLVKNGSKILDVGCGYGLVPAIFAYLNYEAAGVDLPKKYYKIWDFLNDKYGCNIETYNGQKLPFKDGYFDCVTLFGVLEHVGENSDGKIQYQSNEKKILDVQFLKEINRVCKPGGHLFIYNLPNKYSYTEKAAQILGIWYHVKKYEKKEMHEILEISNFNLVKEYHTDILPRQIRRINPKIEGFISKHNQFYNKLDNAILRTPIKILSTDINFICTKRR